MPFPSRAIRGVSPFKGYEQAHENYLVEGPIDLYKHLTECSHKNVRHCGQMVSVRSARVQTVLDFIYLISWVYHEMPIYSIFLNQ